MRSLKSIRLLFVGLLLTGVALLGARCPRGLNLIAFAELSAAGVDKYLGEFTPISSTDVGDGWTKHTFDPDGGDGPICIAGTPFSVFTRAGNPKPGDRHPRPGLQVAGINSDLDWRGRMAAEFRGLTSDGPRSYR